MDEIKLDILDNLNNIEKIQIWIKNITKNSPESTNKNLVLQNFNNKHGGIIRLDLLTPIPDKQSFDKDVDAFNKTPPIPEQSFNKTPPIPDKQSFNKVLFDKDVKAFDTTPSIHQNPALYPNPNDSKYQLTDGTDDKSQKLTGQPKLTGQQRYEAAVKKYNNMSPDKQSFNKVLFDKDVEAFDTTPQVHQNPALYPNRNDSKYQLTDGTGYKEQKLTGEQKYNKDMSAYIAQDNLPGHLRTLNFPSRDDPKYNDGTDDKSQKLTGQQQLTGQPKLTGQQRYEAAVIAYNNMSPDKRQYKPIRMFYGFGGKKQNTKMKRDKRGRFIKRRTRKSSGG